MSEDVEISERLREKLLAVGISSIVEVLDKWEEIGKAKLDFLDIQELNQAFHRAGLDHTFLPVMRPTEEMDYGPAGDLRARLIHVLHQLTIVAAELAEIVDPGELTVTGPNQIEGGKTDGS